MKIRFYIFGIVCVFLTCSFASAEWARFSDYENNGGCEFDRCDTDANCNAGQCHFCDLSSGGNGICKKGSKYDGKDYGSYEECKCVSRKREWIENTKTCCPKGEYNSDGHCCKKDNNDDTKTEVWCEITQKCQSKKESCCPDGSVWDTSDEAKNYTGSETHVPGEGACCSTENWKENASGTECCWGTYNYWDREKQTLVCTHAVCERGEEYNGHWDTSDAAKAYKEDAYMHVLGEGACCPPPSSNWKQNEYGTECCSYTPIGNMWNRQKTPVCEKAYCIDTKGTWDTSEDAKYARTTEGGCCPNGKMKQNKYGTECCNDQRNHWRTNVVTLTPVCAKAYCDENNGTWDTSEDAKNNTDYGTSEGGCCINSDYGATWTKNEYGAECCKGSSNRWTDTNTSVCAKAYCIAQNKHWDTSNDAKAYNKSGTSDGACCYGTWTGTECCSISRTAYNAWTKEATTACCAKINKTLAYNSNGKPYCLQS